MNNELRSKGMSRQVILGVLVIGMGVLFLADNLNLFDLHRAVHFWPLLFILLGVFKLFDTSSSDGYILGSALIGVGVLMIMHRLGLIYFTWRAVWPVLLIALGASVLYRAMMARRVVGDPAKDGMTDVDDTINATAILGGFERRIYSQHFRGGEVTAVMGGCVLDMRNAQIDGEAVINVFVMWGGITIKCPPDWTVILHGTPIMGGFTEKTVSPPDNSKRLVVRGHAIMGGVDVRN